MITTEKPPLRGVAVSCGTTGGACGALDTHLLRTRHCGGTHPARQRRIVHLLAPIVYPSFR
jgi:hypothetical protein